VPVSYPCAGAGSRESGHVMARAVRRCLGIVVLRRQRLRVHAAGTTGTLPLRWRCLALALEVGVGVSDTARWPGKGRGCAVRGRARACAGVRRVCAVCERGSRALEHFLYERTRRSQSPCCPLWSTHQRGWST